MAAGHIGTLGGLPESAQLVPTLICGGLILAIWNRLGFAIAGGGKGSG